MTNLPAYFPIGETAAIGMECAARSAWPDKIQQQNKLWRELNPGNERDLWMLCPPRNDLRASPDQVAIDTRVLNIRNGQLVNHGPATRYLGDDAGAVPSRYMIYNVQRKSEGVPPRYEGLSAQAKKQQYFNDLVDAVGERLEILKQEQQPKQGTGTQAVSEPTAHAQALGAGQDNRSGTVNHDKLREALLAHGGFEQSHVDRVMGMLDKMREGFHQEKQMPGRGQRK